MASKGNHIFFNNTIHLFLPVLLFIYTNKHFAQQQDSSYEIAEVIISSYFTGNSVLHSPGSVNIIDSSVLALHSDNSLLGAMNTVPGVRMEERSPGSYRLSLRGSLLRSPFGIRNVRIYMDEFPFSDAGSNTYLNLLDQRFIKKIKIMKGPEVGLYGSNSGGVVQISTFSDDSNSVILGLNGGSFGTYHQFAKVQYKTPGNTLSINQGWQQSEGYRHNSGLKRHCFLVNNDWHYSKGNKLRFIFLYSDLEYETPGGLTFLQYKNTPEAARPASDFLPGATEQKAGVKNVTLYTGVHNEISLSDRKSVKLLLFCSHSDFENPFITNYEVRNETTLGTKAWIEIKNENEHFPKCIWTTGGEMQETGSRIMNYKNKSGNKDTLRSDIYFDALSGFLFTRLSVMINDRLHMEGSANIIMYHYKFLRLFPLLNSPVSRTTFTPRLIPKLAVLYNIGSGIVWRASASKGFSAPITAELFPSNNILNKDLRPEIAYNYETGIRINENKSFVWFDFTAFYYRLNQAIVRRTNDLGQEFFINAGGTDQYGIESQVDLNIIQKRNYGFVRQMEILQSTTLNHYIFKNYIIETTDFSEKRITGVPNGVIVTGFNISFPESISLFIQHNYTSSIPLNDANSEYADAYHLIQAKTGWKHNMNKKSFLELYAGVDNLLNVQYSLGNDLNAAGGRYYNAAPPRNYYAGIVITFN